MTARHQERISRYLDKAMAKDWPLGRIIDELGVRYGLSQTQAEDAILNWQEIQVKKAA